MLHYHPVNFADDMLALDAAFPRRAGECRLDVENRWYGLATSVFDSFSAYPLAKSVSNISQGNPPWTNTMGEANSNAPAALTYWMHEDGANLAKMFAASLAQCECIEQ